MGATATKVKEETGVARVVPTPSTKEGERAGMVSAITDRLMEKYCGPKSDLAAMESDYQTKLLEAGNDRKAFKKAQDAFMAELKDNYPFAQLKSIDLGQKTLKAKADEGDETILDRDKLRGQIAKVVSRAIEDLNKTAKTIKRMADEIGAENVRVSPLLVGFDEKGAVSFNNGLVRELNKELSPILKEAGIEFVVHFPEGTGLGEGEPEMSILLRPSGKVAMLDLPSLKDIPKRA